VRDVWEDSSDIWKAGGDSEFLWHLQGGGDG